MYISWQDQKVLEEVTYKRNGAVYPWPLNHIQNWRKRRHFLNLLDVYEWKDLHIDEVVEKVEKCCETLCERLGDKEYFYGNRLVQKLILILTEVSCLVFLLI